MYYSSNLKHLPRFHTSKVCGTFFYTFKFRKMAKRKQPPTTSTKHDDTTKQSKYNQGAVGDQEPRNKLQQSPDPPASNATVKPKVDNVVSFNFDKEVTIVNYSKANLQSEAHSFKNGVSEVVWPRVQFIGHSKDLILSPGENSCLARLIAANCSVPENYIEQWWERNVRSVNCILGVKRSNARQKLLVSYFSKCKV